MECSGVSGSDGLIASHAWTEPGTAQRLGTDQSTTELRMATEPTPALMASQASLKAFESLATSAVTTSEACKKRVRAHGYNYPETIEKATSSSNVAAGNNQSASSPLHHHRNHCHTPPLPTPKSLHNTATFAT